MVTLIMFFCVVLLVYEMVQRGHEPVLVTTEAPPSAAVPLDDGATAELKTANLYYADAQGRLLEAEAGRLRVRLEERGLRVAEVRVVTE